MIRRIRGHSFIQVKRSRSPKSFLRTLLLFVSAPHKSEQCILLNLRAPLQVLRIYGDMRQGIKTIDGRSARPSQADLFPVSDRTRVSIATPKSSFDGVPHDSMSSRRPTTPACAQPGHIAKNPKLRECSGWPHKHWHPAEAQNTWRRHAPIGA